MIELDYADSDNQVLTTLRSGKETQVTWTYIKKVVEGANNSTETTEEPTELLTVSMPLAMFKWAITQRGLSVFKYVGDLYKFTGCKFLMVSCAPSLCTCQKKFQNVVAIVNSGSSGMVVSCGCVSCLILNQMTRSR